MSNPAMVLAERSDIHKSCKSIETLLGILNEYCEAAGAMVSLQKRLGKALRDMASSKVTGEIAANAMTASASIFEALSDVDSKFVKLADKEYDSISIEVKKWFKKLAKEEKAHDDRISSANAKIKQAGQLYEKKSKKKATDAEEEHAKYINLISTLGPEVSQEKYNHAVTVNRKHNTTVYSVAACLSRLAETEWQKSSECVRRFSPVVGPLGQWKVLCEGGWTGQVPVDLPDISSNSNPNEQSMSTKQTTDTEATTLKPISEEENASFELQPTANLVVAAPVLDSRQSSEQLVSPPGYTTGPPSASASTGDLTREFNRSSHNSPNLPREILPPVSAQTAQVQIPAAELEQHRPSLPVAPSATETPEPPRAPFFDPQTGSVRTLSAFPAPPTHLPRPRQNSSQLSLQAISNHLEFPSSPGGSNQLAESPVSAHGDLSFSGASDNEEYRRATRTNRKGSHDAIADTPASVPQQPPQSPPPNDHDKQNWRRVSEERTTRDKYLAEELDIRRPTPIRAQTTSNPPVGSSYQSSRDSPLNSRQDPRHTPSASLELKNGSNVKTFTRPESDGRNDEFGGGMNPELPIPKSHVAAKYAKTIERTDTGASNGSIVAAMRDRYSNNTGSMSPPPRDLPRLPLSVNDLATRYKSADAPLSPQMGARSPPVLRQQSLPMLETATRLINEPHPDRITPRTPIEEDPRRRPQQIQQEEQQQPPQGQRYDKNINLERKVKEHQLKERELELERRALELEREKARLQTLREDDVRAFETGQNIYRDGGNGAQAQQINQFGLRPRERRTSLKYLLQRPSSQMDLDEQPRKTSSGSPSNKTRPQGQYSNSNTREYLGAPSPILTQPLSSHKYGGQSPQTPIDPYESRTQERHSPNDTRSNTTNSSSGTGSASAHAPYCGCEFCSVSKYRESGKASSKPLPKQADQRSEDSNKSRGSWIRRLSMPVGNAFSSNEGKKHQSNNSTGNAVSYALGSGIGNVPPSPGRHGLFSMDYKKNASTTALMTSSSSHDERGLYAQEDGRLRFGGVSNRSMTNLGILGRH